MTFEASELSELIGDIYDAALEPALWRVALGRSCAFLGASSALLHWHDVAGENSAALHPFNDDPYYTRLYVEKYWSMNPVFPAATFVERGVVYTPSEMIPQAELTETRFYKEWLRPQGIVGCVASNLEKGAASSTVLTIRRNEEQGNVDQEMRRRAALIVPHFQRAASIGRLFDQTRATQAVLTETLENIEAGIFLVGPNGHIVFANAPGRVMLDEGTLLRESRNALAAVEPAAQRMLRDIFLAAENADTPAGRRGMSIPLSTSPRGRWFAHVLPLTSGDRQKKVGSLHSAVAAVFVRKTSPASPLPLEALTRFYKLTTSEVRVLDGVMRVSGVRGLADLLGLSQATVKTHLHNVFRKTGTSRQSELVKLVAGFEPRQASAVDTRLS
ncbi:helix-turn-helix transcriptional regulator [Bradyrhizobium sp. USDA 3650]